MAMDRTAPGRVAHTGGPGFGTVLSDQAAPRGRDGALAAGRSSRWQPDATDQAAGGSAP
jgi:hypothetical protein